MRQSDDRPSLPSSPAPVSAEALYDLLRATITDALAEANENEYLAVDYHTPSGDVLHVTDFGYHSTDLLSLSARDRAEQACRVLLHTSALQLVLKYEKGGRPSHRPQSASSASGVNLRSEARP